MLPLHRGDLSFKDHPAESQTSLAKLTRFVKIEFQVHPFRTVFLGFALATFIFVMLSADSGANSGSNPPWMQGNGAAGKYQGKGDNYYQKEMWRIEGKNIIIDDKDMDDGQVEEETQTFPEDDEDEEEDDDDDDDDDDYEENENDDDLADEKVIVVHERDNVKADHENNQQNDGDKKVNQVGEGKKENEEGDGDDDDDDDDDDENYDEDKDEDEDPVEQKRELEEFNRELVQHRKLDLDNLHKLGKNDLEKAQNEIKKAIENAHLLNNPIQDAVKNIRGHREIADQKEDIIHLQPKLDDQKYDPITQEEAKSRQTAIKEAFRYAWKSYKDGAFGADELNTVNCKAAEDWMGMGLTIVDGIDGLWILGLEEEYNEARNWIAEKLNFDQVKKNMCLKLLILLPILHHISST
eukprot:TRINITY_DN2878_c0_g2_i6.p1 TRINITY_DN2878_c0_g2~~TRINITY_DN2878_c0_g2_i6.p1  ORF type:complete len:409 (-),score=118.01 TRINITY_DN2878_c0_g2_i6:1402-2628(-)